MDLDIYVSFRPTNSWLPHVPVHVSGVRTGRRYQDSSFSPPRSRGAGLTLNRKKGFCGHFRSFIIKCKFAFHPLATCEQTPVCPAPPRIRLTTRGGAVEKRTGNNLLGSPTRRLPIPGLTWTVLTGKVGAMAAVKPFHDSGCTWCRRRRIF